MSLRRWSRTMGLALVLLALAGCGVDLEPQMAAAPYPDLYSVPPRPTVEFSLPQRQQIAQALESDRTVAMYDKAADRAALGLGGPPAGSRPDRIEQPEPPPGGVSAMPPPQPPAPLPPGGGLIAELAVRQQVLVERNNGRLQSFTRILERQLELDRQLEEAGLGRLPDPRPGGPGAPANEPIDRVRFAPSSSELPEEVDGALRAAIATATAQRARLAVVGQGAPTELALNRARAVASQLMRLGAPRRMVTMRLGGAGNEVTLHLLPADAA
jgi:hypothetical protein